MSVPELKRLEEFKKELANYHISEASKKILRETRLVIMTGPTSGGRNTLIRELLKTGQYHFIISDTTRPQRYNDGVLEQDGVEYWFRTEDEVLQDIKDGKYLEAELIHGQQVSGISIRELQAARDEGKIAINEIELGGNYAVSEAKPEAVSIIVLPPSFHQWQQRLKRRGHMHTEEIKRRMATAIRIFDAAATDSRFKLVVNDELKHAAGQIHELATTGNVDKAEQQRYRELAKQLRDDTKEYLNSLS